MDDKYLISIIMPIYNSETYLSDSIDSIINQSIGFSNIELILIDDKSTDNTREVIQKYASKYENILPIYLPSNTGYPGVVRNKGLEKSTSKYIMFIDSDDEYEVDMCEVLYKTITENDCDCVECKSKNLDYLTKEVTQESNNPYEKHLSDSMDALYTSTLVVWNKIFKKSIITENNIKFPMKYAEDAYFSIDYLINSKSIIFLENYKGYKYIDRGESLTTPNLDWSLNVINQLYETFEFINERGIKLDIPRFFNNSINYCIIIATKMGECDYNSLFKVLNELYHFEKTIGFRNYQGFFLFKFINKFIETNHIYIATAITLIINRIYHIEAIFRIYRKLINILK